MVNRADMDASLESKRKRIAAILVLCVAGTVVVATGVKGAIASKGLGSAALITKFDIEYRRWRCVENALRQEIPPGDPVFVVRKPIYYQRVIELLTPRNTITVDAEHASYVVSIEALRSKKKACYGFRVEVKRTGRSS